MWTSYLSNEELIEVLKEYILKNKYTKDIENELLLRHKQLEYERHEEAFNQGYQYGYEDGQMNCDCDYSCDDNCPYKDKFEKLKKAVMNLEEFV